MRLVQSEKSVLFSSQFKLQKPYKYKQYLVLGQLCVSESEFTSLKRSHTNASLVLIWRFSQEVEAQNKSCICMKQA